MNPLLAARGLVKHFTTRTFPPWRRLPVRAVDGVDLTVEAGRCLALVGESGSGKSTLGLLLVGLLTPTAGRVLFRGQDLATLSPSTLRRERRRFQMVFQDPFSSLDPRMRVGETLAEPLAAHDLLPRPERRQRVDELLALVGLAPDAADRLPHQFSGGQRQRIAIARALSTGPEVLIADEPVSALDVSIQAQILELLADLSERLDLAVVLISHDLAVVEQVADRVAVMYLGKIVEEADRRRLFSHPQHPYTVSLLAAVPALDPKRRERALPPLTGDPPSPVAPPPGCTFHPRCPIARPRCAVEAPPLCEVVPGHRVSCHAPGELTVADRALPSEPFLG